jgi:hypothetical protein
MASKVNGASLALRKSYALALNEDSMAQLGEVLGPGERLDIGHLPRIKVPAGGGRNWELPDGSAAPEVEGILVLRHAVRAYWSESIDEGGGGQPPNCSSVDGVQGVGDPGVVCETCRFNEWASAKSVGGKPSRAKACREITRMYILRPGNLLPTLFAAPPSAKRAATTYVLNFAIEGYKATSFVTKLTLAETSNRDGVKFSQPVFTRGEQLDDATAQDMAAYKTQIEPVLMAVEVGGGDG